MSISTNRRLSSSAVVSIASRVVPGSSETITRSAPRKAFSSEDFPTLGRPMIARLAEAPREGGRGGAAPLGSSPASAA